MRKFRIVLILIVMIGAMIIGDRTVAITRPAIAPQNVAVVYGLHIAVPDDMKTFPAELVPLP
jgi:hypothetical protein